MNRPQTTKVYDLYWQFAYKRQEAFFNRLKGNVGCISDDPVIQKYKFTNAYRATDRVSQYLIKNVIYKDNDYSNEDILFRILLFKLFNKIETWQYLENAVGDITLKSFNIDKYDSLLRELLNEKIRIYSAAYIMPSGKSAFGNALKHRNNLELLDLMMHDNLSLKIAKADSLSKLYSILLDYPSIGPFLAFQYAIDINYSELCDFSEMSFVVAGPGAKSGIQKTFVCDKYDYEYFIKYVADHQEEEFERRGYKFQTLFGRPLQLIDCQNLFCETDKYSRIVCPDITSKQNRTRIKQYFSPKSDFYELFLPPKWNLKY